MILQNIPQELRELRQWVAAGEDKKPLNPCTGQAASPTDPATWGSFLDAVNCGYRHIGFVLHSSDPYCVIDLDDPATVKANGVVMPNPDQAAVDRIAARHRRILEAFTSYAEISQSGTGIHIVVRAKVPHGVKRDKVEVYSDARYMIFTGNIIKNLPISDNQTLVDMLFAEMEQGRLSTVELEQVQSHLTDEELFNMAAGAQNAGKFLQLWHGNWQGVPEWPTQSEADFALLAMLGFYSLDNQQVRRVFRLSALGQREKATRNDKYLNYALAKIRAKQSPAVDLSNLEAAPVSQATPALPGYENIAQVAEPLTISETPVELVPVREEIQPDTLPMSENPPGFVGALADYFFSSAIRPVRDIALCSAIALTGGVVGRSFNVSGTGLNQYLVMLANTGAGKEGLATGIDGMLNAIRPTCPMIDEFMGPSSFASGQALIRVLDKSPCFVSILGEFGFLLHNLCSPTASSAETMLKKVLLDIYSKSGWGKFLRSTAYSDTEKNTKMIQAPNVTILGESTPDIFYSGLDAAAIAQGLIPRFTIFEYTGPRPETNPNAFHAPDAQLTRYFAGLAGTAMSAAQNRVCAPVQSNQPATDLFKQFDRYADQQINTTGNELTKQLWNRAHLKALKMAALIAVGNNPHQPIIDRTIGNWAINLIHADITRLQAKFESGAIGTGDVRLELDARQAITEYLSFDRTKRLTYSCPLKMANVQLIPYGYLRRRLRLLGTFRNDRRGANKALDDTLQAMVNGDVLQRLNPLQARQYETTAPVFMVGPSW